MLPTGLHPRFNVAAGHPDNTGLVLSTVHTYTCRHMLLLPHPSYATYVRIRVRTPSDVEPGHRFVVVGPVQITVGVLQLSVAPIDPEQCGIVSSLGLHPKLFVTSHAANGCGLNAGGVTSTVQVTTCVQVF